jgi:sporulation protein YlmC with PRC-barrel domain
MDPHEIHLEQLLNRRVFASNGRPVGRLEEICAERREKECFITEYHVGVYALFERVAGSAIGRAVLRLFGGGRSGYRIPWDKLDLSDPAHLRLRCKVSELLPL